MNRLAPRALGGCSRRCPADVYVQRGTNDGGVGAAAGGRRVETRTATADGGGSDGGDGSAGAPSDDGSASRVGTTNAQVEGVDEPDLVKTDGEHFYYAAGAVDDRYRPRRDGVDYANESLAVETTVELGG